MKIFKEYPLLTIWLIILTVMLAISLIRVKVEVTIHADDHAQVRVQQHRHYGVTND